MTRLTENSISPDFATWIPQVTEYLITRKGSSMRRLTLGWKESMNCEKRRAVKIELRGLCKRSSPPCFNAIMAVCQARVLDCEQVFPRTGEKFHTTKECGAGPKVKIGVDDGEASMYICASCFRRFSKRSAVPGNWYGWFDCEYPPGARVKFSPWWRAAAAAEEATPALPLVAVAEQIDDTMESEEDEQSEEDVRVTLLMQQIAAMEISLQKNTAHMKMKEVVAAHKQLIQARAELKIIQRA